MRDGETGERLLPLRVNWVCFGADICCEEEEEEEVAAVAVVETSFDCDGERLLPLLLPAPLLVPPCVVLILLLFLPEWLLEKYIYI